MRHLLLSVVIALAATNAPAKELVVQNPGTAPLWPAKAAQASSVGFAWDLYREVSLKTKGNAVVAPVDALAILATLRFGARGETEASLTKVMRVPGNAVMPELTFGSLYTGLQSKSYASTLAFALEAKTPRGKGFEDFLKQHFASTLQAGSRPDVVLSTALTFKSAATSSGTMQATTAVAKADRCDLSDPTFALTVIRPQAGKTVQDVDAKAWIEIDQKLTPAGVETFPKIQIDASTELLQAIEAMGGKTALGPDADYKGISTEKLKVGGASQKILVDINAQGTSPTPYVWVVHQKSSGLIVLLGSFSAL